MFKFKRSTFRIFLGLIDIVVLSGTVEYLLGKSHVENKQIGLGIFNNNLENFSDVELDRISVDNTRDTSEGTTDGVYVEISNRETDRTSIGVSDSVKRFDAVGLMFLKSNFDI